MALYRFVNPLLDELGVDLRLNPHYIARWDWELEQGAPPQMNPAGAYRLGARPWSTASSPATLLRATQTELRRAISCAYYAMFHTLAASNANTLTGASPADQQRWAWQQTYRAADHRPTRETRSVAPSRSCRPVPYPYPQDFGEVFADCPASSATPPITIPHSDILMPTDATGPYRPSSRTAINDFNQTPDDIRRDLAVHILTSVLSD